MLGIKELKERIEITETTVECPVKRCKVKVKKMNRGDQKRLDSYLDKGKTSEAREVFRDYFCKEHRIYVTPTKFLYENYRDNLLWYEDDDKVLFDNMMKIKRVKYQLYHDNSEDALSWNVFRFLERNNLLSGFLEGLHNPEVIYWSYSQSQQKVWDELERARKEFGESQQRSSEPDLIIKSEDILVFIEAKLTAPTKYDFNKDHTAEEKDERIRRYSKSDRFLNSSIEEIIDAKYYQLMRFWLIGSSIAERLNLEFYLVNLVLSGKEEDIERDFKGYIKEDQHRKFARITWEDIHEYISSRDLLSKDKDIMTRYFRNKTIGYEEGDIYKELHNAFSIP